MSLPQKLTVAQMQVTWATAIDPVIANPLVKGNILKSIALKPGLNVINHGLGRTLQGWYTTRVRSAASFYDTQDTNQMPQLTLQLVASADVTIDLAVF